MSSAKRLCIACNQRYVTKGLICKSCSARPFKIEKLRAILAGSKSDEALISTYSSNYTEIKNINTPRFWDNKWTNTNPLKYQDGMTKDRIKTVASYIKNSKLNILDIAAGYGWLEEELKGKEKLMIYANDFSKKSVRVLKSKFKGNFKVESVYKLHYPKNSFHIVTILEVLEHIPPSKVFKVYKKICSLLRKRGMFIVSVPLNEGLDRMKDNPNGHVRAYTVPIIERELVLNGFKIMHTHIFYAFKKNYRLKKALARLLPQKWEPNNVVICATKL